VKTMQNSRNNDRIPLIVSTKMSGFSIGGLIQKAARKNMEFVHFDLRKASNLKHSAKMAMKTIHQSTTMKEFDRYMTATKESLAQAVVEGECFLISIDDSPIPYESIYDPDLKEYTSKENFPNELFNLAEFKIPEVYRRV